MRARGAKVTDIVVLVVAADDGVMPQTVEAINHAKAAKVPMIVAINKIDKPDAQARARAHRAAAARNPGRDRSAATCSTSRSRRTKRLNLDKLLEMIGAAGPKSSSSRPIRTVPAEGTVIEAKLDRGRGPVATVLVQRGTLDTPATSSWPAPNGAGCAHWRQRHRRTASSPPGRRCRSRCLASTARRKRATGSRVVDSEARAREITDYRARQKREKIGGARRPACAARSSR